METLNNYSNKNPFKVPEGYFESFNQELMSKIEEQDDKKSKWRIKSIRPFFAIAAGFLIILALWGLLLKQFDKNTTEVAENEIQTNEMKYLESVSSDEMIDMVTMEDVQTFDIDINNPSDVNMIIDEVETSSIMDAF